MTKLLNCRRSLLALIGLLLLTGLAIINKVDVQASIVGIILAVAGSNAYEASKGKGGP